MIEIAFPNKSAAEAGKLAQQLRAELIRGGFDANALSIDREDPEAQDAGTILHIGLVTFEAIALAKTLYEICIPASSTIRIKTPRGKFEVEPNELDGDFLRKFLLAIQDTTTEK